jgi:flagellar hook-basal body complex protein FliE
MSDLGLSAARAYQSVAQSLAATQADRAQPAAPGFGEILNSAAASLSQATTGAEGAITNAALGRGDLVDVVTAVAAAEATLQTVVAVRDEVIKAYQDILRMPI